MNNLWVWLLQQILPRRYWYRNLYLRSNHWRKIRAAKIQQAKRRCLNCGHIIPHNQLVDVHHKYYYSNRVSILWHEKLNDLQVLCRACHNKEHS